MINRTSLSYKEVLRLLHKIGSTKCVFKNHDHEKLMRMAKMLESLSITQESLRNMNIIHIAGTKGKGTASCYCELILRNHGYRTGMYTSPHLIDPRERIRLNGDCISEQAFSEYFEICYKAAKRVLVGFQRRTLDLSFLKGRQCQIL
ncbi:hypothetical protein ACOME3_006964 [Neoechinorhynchus agilis]